MLRLSSTPAKGGSDPLCVFCTLTAKCGSGHTDVQLVKERMEEVEQLNAEFPLLGIFEEIAAGLGLLCSCVFFMGGHGVCI